MFSHTPKQSSLVLKNYKLQGISFCMFVGFLFLNVEFAFVLGFFSPPQAAIHQHRILLFFKWTYKVLLVRLLMMIKVLRAPPVPPLF